MDSSQKPDARDRLAHLFFTRLGMEDEDAGHLADMALAAICPAETGADGTMGLGPVVHTEAPATPISSPNPSGLAEALEPTHAAACRYAETSDDPLASMLRDASERLDRPVPDVAGARVALHGARLGQASQALAAHRSGEPDHVGDADEMVSQRSGTRTYTEAQLRQARRYTDADYDEVKRNLYPRGQRT